MPDDAIQSTSATHETRAEVTIASRETTVGLETSTEEAALPSETQQFAPSTPAASDDDASGAHLVAETWITLKFAWQGKDYTLEIAESDCVYDLKGALQRLTNVPLERQKILGLVKGKVAGDDVRIRDLQPIGKKLTLIGTPAGKELKDPDELDDLPEVLNDFDFDLATNPVAAQAYINDQRNIRKIKETARKLQINVMNPLREGKKLLVLDIDYTILDTKPLTSGLLPAQECARPGLHEFLTLAYRDYDIVIWSQTSWSWLELKLHELGMVGGTQLYKIAFVLDKGPMFSVYSTRDGKTYKHAVKPLRVIWTHFPQFNAKNTIHIDDLSRNFALNPGEGLKISPFRDCHTAQSMADKELKLCGLYLDFLSNVADFSTVDHTKWRTVALALNAVANRRQTSS
ncbi:HAD-superfamily subfamily IIID h [Exidia glandulosa HHB12029]|uniref:protein-serine/threonine phosphatase n=1 Tax=Exidia glandulosa HHB12029 TaxID=1314781 RepID=A0A165KE25_EXIGL|nr:HAD-superfamily subfamily IIID h [Exidia glandulosa HHB12029]